MKALLIQGNLSRWLWTLSWPMLIGFISLSSVPLVDVILVSKLGELPRAMISLILPLTLVAMGLPIGLNVALSTLLARHIGEGQTHKIGPLFTFAVSSVFLLACGSATLVSLFYTEIFHLLGVYQEEGIQLLKEYFIPWIWGWCPLTVVVSINAIFRAQGLPRPISAIMFFAALIHIVADLVLIEGWGFIPALGISGAGWAEVITGLGALIYSFFWQKKLGVLKYWKWKRPDIADIKILSSQALAASFAYVLPVAAQIMVQRALVQVDITALSIYGAVARLEVIGTMPVMSISSALTPLIAQNRGAGALSRCKKAVRVALFYGCLLSLIYVSLLHLFTPYAASLFHIQGSEQLLFQSMLTVLTPAWLLWGLCFVPLGCFYGSERSGYVVQTALVRLTSLFVFLQFAENKDLEIIRMMTFTQVVYALAVLGYLYAVFRELKEAPVAGNPS